VQPRGVGIVGLHLRLGVVDAFSVLPLLLGLPLQVLEGRDPEKTGPCPSKRNVIPPGGSSCVQTGKDAFRKERRGAEELLPGRRGVVQDALELV
jgi:hypothetical protein